MSGALCGSLVAKVLALHCTSIPYGSQFVTQLLYFSSSTLLVSWEKSRVLGPYLRVGDPEKASDS